jgi:hypothetical protein
VDDDDDDDNDDDACGSSCNVCIVFVRFLPKSELVGQFLKELKYKFSRKSFRWQYPCSVWGGGPTNGNDVANCRFRNCFAKALERQTQKRRKMSFSSIFK